MRINIARDFSIVPSGRTPDDGPDNGERFREELLVPPLTRGEVVELEIDDAVGYQSSFLEEAFGPLAERTGLPRDVLVQRIVVITSDPRFAVFAELIRKFTAEGR